MENIYKPGIISMLGGGQLGKMFIAEAMRLDLKVRVLDPDPACPCAPYAHEFVCGSLTDYETVLNFCAPGYPVTIEIENVNVASLRSLKKMGVKVVPDPELLEMVQDKGLQKQFYLNNRFPTSNFELVESAQVYVRGELAFPFVQKTRKGGYDGKGVLIVKSPSEWPKKALYGPSIIEDAVKIKAELGVLVVGDGKGDYKIYEPVEMVFDNRANLVDYLLFPSTQPEFLKEEAKRLALSLAQKLNLVGLLAVELFVTENDEILINEIAPRTHNSGHAGIEASVTSQFEQHVRIMAELPLGSPLMLYDSAMINLLGKDGYVGVPQYKNLDKIAAIPGVYIHLYGKSQMKPDRKMGHITLIALNHENIHEKISKVKLLLA